MNKALTFLDCVELIKRGRYGRKKLANNTYLYFDSNVFIITLHGYPIIKIQPNNDVSVSNCGWYTQTTKRRINQFTNSRIYQKNFIWYFGNGQLFQNGAMVPSLNKNVALKLVSQVDKLMFNK